MVRGIFKKLPEYQIIYFGDTARTPYGTKSRETIIKYARENAEFLLNKGAKIIIVACNTASAVASGILREELKIPVFEVIMPAVKRALAVTSNGRIGVIGTRATIRSGVYDELLKKWSSKASPSTSLGINSAGFTPDREVGARQEASLLQIFSEAAPLLVPLVEECWLNQPETKRIVKKYLQPLKNKQIDTLILGCTHYPVLKHIIGPRIGRRVRLVDSAEEAVDELKDFLNSHNEVEGNLEKGSDHRFYISDLTAQVPKIAEKLLGRKVALEKVEVG